MQPSDEELLKAMQRGEEDAFVSLYRRWQPAIYRFGLQMTGSSPAAEDVVQEVFMALIWNSGGYCSSRGSFSSWLYGIARHSIAHMTSRKTVVASLGDAADEVDRLCAPNCDPHAKLVHRQQTDWLKSALLALPSHYREAIVLCIFHEMDYAESASIIGCSIGTVRSRLHRARAILAERLRSNEDEPEQALEKIVPNGCVL
jgi:RNA polymerase sigma-70 factor, ECF subfamily